MPIQLNEEDGGRIILGVFPALQEEQDKTTISNPGAGVSVRG